MRVPADRVGRFSSGMTPWLSYVTTTAVPTQVDAGKGAAGSRSPAPEFPRLPFPGFTAAGASGGVGSGGLFVFAILLFGLLLVIPNAVRWLRAALALGLSPAYVAIGDRPG
jgi:hypothetical protein